MNLGAIQNTAAKKELTSPCLLVHYDPRKVVLLFSIVSPCCIGPVLRITLTMDDGSKSQWHSLNGVCHQLKRRVNSWTRKGCWSLFLESQSLATEGLINQNGLSSTKMLKLNLSVQPFKP